MSLTTAVLLLAFAPNVRYIVFSLLLQAPPLFFRFFLFFVFFFFFFEFWAWATCHHGGPTPHAHRHRGHGVPLAGGRVDPWRVLPHVMPSTEWVVTDPAGPLQC